MNSSSESIRCDHCGHEGPTDSADYYGREIEVCENCGAEVSR